MKVTSPQVHHRTYLPPGTTTPAPAHLRRRPRLSRGRRSATFRGKRRPRGPQWPGRQRGGCSWAGGRPRGSAGTRVRRKAVRQAGAACGRWAAPHGKRRWGGRRSGKLQQGRARKMRPDPLPPPQLKPWSGRVREGPSCSGAGARTGNAAPTALTPSADRTGTSHSGRGLRAHPTLREISARLRHAMPLEPSRVLRGRPPSPSTAFRARPRPASPGPPHLAS